MNPTDCNEANTLAPATTSQIAELRSLLPDKISCNPQELNEYSRDSSRATPAGLPAAVLHARTTSDIQTALTWANKHRIPVSVRGAGTGLAGGALAYAGGLAIDMSQMRQIKEIDAANQLATVEPGVITAELDNAAREYGLFFAPDPASAKTSTIGGNVSTNAGGLRCVSHGVMSDAVAALEVVLPTGEVMRCGAKTRKNVVGYNLTKLFIGAEGTLGIITEITVRLKPLPPGEPRTFRAGFPTLEKAGAAVTAIVSQAQKPEVLELMDALSVEIVESFHATGVQIPSGALLIGQTVGPDAQKQAESIIEICLAHGADETEIANDDRLLEARRLSNPALTARGLKLSCDVGVPVAQLSEVFAGIAALAAKHELQVSTVAHAGDGNLHTTVEAPEDAAGVARAEALLDDITKLAISLGGTISGEHGIGITKQHELPWQLDEVALAVQHRIKQALDPNGILTPGRAI